jgi:hypothetical protein
VFGKIPKNEQDRIHKNIEFYNKAIGRESVEEEKEELQES